MACYDRSKLFPRKTQVEHGNSVAGRTTEELRNSDGLSLSGFSKQLLLGQRDAFGRSPLHLVCCAAKGLFFRDAARLLLDEMTAAEVNAVDNLGRSALMYAGRNVHYAAFCEVLECCPSVEVNRRDPATGNTAFLLLMHEANAPVWSERVDAINRRFRRIFDGFYPRSARPDVLLKPQPYDYFLNMDTSMSSPKRKVYTRSLKEVWALLQQQGCDITARNNQGEDCFALALKYRGRTFAKCLREVVR
ncbi:unnamed protein product [Amoebophrya sp. A25]|nr:unnamed protein product [Amoebophrya sp. A25]|eukprot:GSA25T00004142001.1